MADYGMDAAVSTWRLSMNPISQYYSVPVAELAPGAENSHSSQQAPAQSSSVSEPSVVNNVNPVKVINAVDSFFDLGNPNRLNSLFTLKGEEREKFLQSVVKLVKEGFMGYNYYEVDGEIIKEEPIMAMVDKRLRNAKVYNRRGDLDYLRD
jgi:hypothetical protein